jgi:hypothetical protein
MTEDMEKKKNLEVGYYMIIWLSMLGLIEYLLTKGSFL